MNRNIHGSKFITAKQNSKNHLTCSLTENWIIKLWNRHRMECYTVAKSWVNEKHKAALLVMIMTQTLRHTIKAKKKEVKVYNCIYEMLYSHFQKEEGETH